MFGDSHQTVVLKIDHTISHPNNKESQREFTGIVLFICLVFDSGFEKKKKKSLSAVLIQIYQHPESSVWKPAEVEEPVWADIFHFISRLNLNMLVVFVCLPQAYTYPAGRAAACVGMFMSYGEGRKHVSILIIITRSQRACRSVSRLPPFPLQT